MHSDSLGSSAYLPQAIQPMACATSRVKDTRATDGNEHYTWCTKKCSVAILKAVSTGNTPFQIVIEYIERNS
jgi:hypothetical protein